MAVKKISDLEVQTLENRTVAKYRTDTPSDEAGYTAKDFKKTLYKFVTDNSDGATSIVNFINRIVNEINTELNQKFDKSSSYIKSLSFNEDTGLLSIVVSSDNTEETITKDLKSFVNGLLDEYKTDNIEPLISGINEKAEVLGKFTDNIKEHGYVYGLSYDPPNYNVIIVNYINEFGEKRTRYFDLINVNGLMNGSIFAQRAKCDINNDEIHLNYARKDQSIANIFLNHNITKEELKSAIELDKVENKADLDRTVGVAIEANHATNADNASHADSSNTADTSNYSERSHKDSNGNVISESYVYSVEQSFDADTMEHRFNLLNGKGESIGVIKINRLKDTFVSSGEYDNVNKQIILHLNADTDHSSDVRIDVKDWVIGLQKEITPENKLSYSLIDGGPDLSGYQPLITDSDKLSYNLLKDTPEIPEPATSDMFDEGLRIYHHYGTPNSDSQYPDEVHNIYLQRLQADGTYKTISKIRFYDDLSGTAKAFKYDNDTQKLIVTTYGGMEKKVSLAPLIEGLQPLLGATNKLNPQYVSEDDNYQFISKALKQVIVDLNDAGVIEKLDNIEQENIEFSTWAHNVKSSMATFKSYLGLE